MMTDDSVPERKAAQLQEAIDTIAQAFDYPPSLSLHFTAENGSKQTTIELDDSDAVFELSYDGREDDAEPVLVKRE